MDRGKVRQALILLKDGRTTEARSLLGPADDGVLDDAMRALDHGAKASSALRSGRVDELVTSARAAAAEAPSSMPHVVFYTASLLQAAYRFTGQAGLRKEALDRCSVVADRLDLPRLAVQARGLMGNIHMMHGRLHRALELCDAALDLAARSKLEADPVSAMAHQFRGYVLFEWNRLEPAEAALQRAWDLAGSSRGVGTGVARVMALLQGARGDETEAEEWLERLEGLMDEPQTLRNREWLEATRVRILLGRGDLRRVQEWLHAWEYHPLEASQWDSARMLARLHELEQTMALLEATAQWQAILELAPRVVEAAGDERPWFAARWGSARAAALEASGRSREADKALTGALELGRQGSFVRAYTDGHPIRGRLIRRLAQHEEEEAAVRVLDASPALRDHRRDPLTPAQTRVLERVAAGASNKKVARDLDVSVSTVRTHLREVFTRLGVKSRTEAVSAARKRGLLKD